MSFTCPDCLWTSSHTQDAANCYCGHCHEFKTHDFEPTSFQLLCTRALKSADPTPLLRQAIVQRRMQLASLAEIYIELSHLTTASRLPEQSRRALSIMINTVRHAEIDRPG